MSKQGYTQASQALVENASNDPREQTKRIAEFMRAREAQLAKFVTGGIRPESLIRFLCVDLMQNEKLRKCSRESLYLGLLSCAVTGLEPSSIKGEAALVPFANAVTFIPMWKGLVKQARRSRDVIGIVANVVREADAFDIDIGTANSIVHKPARGDRGDVIASYAIAQLANGHREVEFLDRSDLERIKAVAEKRGPSPAWRDWSDQMSRKSSIRRLCKRLPLGETYFAGLALDEAVDRARSTSDEARAQADVLDVLTGGESNSVVSSPQIAPVSHDMLDPNAEPPQEGKS